MNRKLKTVYLFCLVSGLLWSESVNSGGQELHPISLDIHDGVGSLLLDWSFSDTIQVKEINIYRRFGEEKKFNLIASLSNSVKVSNRYLDKNCENQERYFYLIEIEATNGKIYKSDDIRPSFGTSLDRVGQNVESFFSIWDIISHLFKDSFSEYYPQSSAELKNAIIDILSMDNNDAMMLWIENFPLKYLDELRSIIKNPSYLVFQDQILDKMRLYEKIYRNEFLLTPVEWNRDIKDVYFTTKDKWILLIDSFQEYSNLIEQTPPLFIIGSESDFNEFNMINIYVVDVKKIVQKKISLKYKEEAVDILSTSLWNTGSELRIEVPNNWEFVELLIEDKIIDRIDFIESKKIIKTLDGDNIPVNKIKGLKLSKEETEIWLNELYWNPNTEQLSLEIAGVPNNSSKKFIIGLNNIDLWNIDFEHQSFDIQYSDSTFNIDLFNIDEPITLFYDVIEENQRRSVELVKLIATDIVNIHRFPDGEKWRNAGQNTFGSENIDQKNVLDASLIPEVFVLYQNYPNPFNSNTRISFDLLQDAILSLYVTDATGRIKTIFSDKEFYNSGKYNFDWNAESFSTGVYFFIINAEVEGFLPVIFSRKMIYLK
tara:strand:+ start:85 stop:1881 length:1797 start_codon:yes stop_codon:yes gene_type:complete